MTEQLRVEYRKIETLIPFARNPRTHSEAQIAKLASSIVEFGWTQPILVDGVNGIIAGHGRLAAARKLDLLEVPVMAAELFAPADPLGDAVQMMTVHKSKGLEFDTVIVPGLHRETGANESSLLLWDKIVGPDNREHLLVAPLKARDAANGEPTAYDYLRRLEGERAAHEDERLLYVAATRAIYRLHLVGVAELNDKSDDGLRQPPSGSFLRLLWPVVAQARFAAALAAEVPVDLAPAVDASSFVPPLLRLAEPAIPDELARPSALSRPVANPIQALEAPAAATSATQEAAVGTLVHRCLELIVRQGLAAWPPERLPTLVDGWQRWLRAQGLDAGQAEAGASEALAALQTTLASETGRWLLTDHPGGGAEQAWTSRDGNLAVNHVIDRIFIADGVRWIVDYKTVRAAPEALAARAESFRPQLERYAALFAGDPLPLKLAVWFALQGQLEVLSRGD